MTTDEMIDALNGDLANEYKHWHFYMNAAVRVQGLHRLEIREFLLEQAKQEMEHVQAFADLIIGLGGEPLAYPAEFETNVKCPAAILKYALSMEKDVLVHFLQRMEQAEGLDDRVWGRRIVIFLEDQMDDTGRDVDEINQLLGRAKGGENCAH